VFNKILQSCNHAIIAILVVTLLTLLRDNAAAQKVRGALLRATNTARVDVSSPATTEGIHAVFDQVADSRRTSGLSREEWWFVINALHATKTRSGPTPKRYIFTASVRNNTTFDVRVIVPLDGSVLS
jgi:hypothetical protein